MWTISNKCYHSDRVDSNMIDFNTTQGSLRDNGTTEKVFKCSQATWNIWETHSVKADNFRVEVVSTRTTCLCYFVTTLCQKMDPNVWRHFCLTSGWPLGLHQPFDFELFRNFRSVKGLLNLLIRNKESVLWVNLTRFFLAFSTLGWELFMKIMKSNLKFHLKNHETSPPTKLLSERMPTLKYPNAVSQLSADS